MAVGDERHPPAALLLGMTRYPLYKGVGWVTRPVWTGAGNLAPTGIQTQDRPSRRERHTDYAIPVRYELLNIIILNFVV